MTNKILHNMLHLCLALSLVAAAVSCSNSARNEFDRLLVTLAADDATIDHADWEKIVSYIDDNKAKLSDFYDGDTLSVERVKTYISKMFDKRRPPLHIEFTGIGQAEHMAINMYLERSGSMTPYDAPQGDGTFKSAIVRMLNNLPGSNDDNKIFVVNSTITSYPEGFASFISDNNIFEATKGLGDPSYTDFGTIFETLLNKTGDNELGILVTDMIYSTKKMIGTNPTKVFTEAQGMINSVFKDVVKKKSMLIIKMRGSYNGPYYTFCSPNAGTTYNGHRPYYIIVVGNNDNIARLTKDPEYGSFAKFESLPGYQAMYMFNTSDEYRPYYSLLLRNTNIRGRFQPEHGQPKAITRIKGMKADSNSGDMRMVLAVDLNGMLIAKDYATDISNYRVIADSPVKLLKIMPINKEDITPAEKKYIGSATHLFVLEAKDISHKQEVEIRLQNRLPAWVAESSSDDDRDTDAPRFADTTFGLRYLLQGIYDSYERNSNGEPYYFSMKLSFDD